jgi:hypothetical protein
MSIHIDELLPNEVSIKEFTTGSELLLASEVREIYEDTLTEGLIGNGH